jgi:serine/threonine protein phosphatase PrpC
VPGTVPLGLPPAELGLKSDPGRDPDKQVNEDAAGVYETRFGHLSVVCDGMGGHVGGREASNLALAAISETFERAEARPDVPLGARGRELLREAVLRANALVFQLAHEGAAHPGSTVVAILLHAAGTEVAHVGDSRCYLVHQGQILQVTKDHSMVQELVDHGVLTPAQAAVHPDANRITRALGMHAEVDVDVRAQSLSHVAGDVFVLCSDGLSDLVGPSDIVKIAGAAPPQQAAGQLVDLANARGGHDNISVVIVRAGATAIDLTGESVGGGARRQIGLREAVEPTVTDGMPSRTVLAGPVSEAAGPMSAPVSSMPRSVESGQTTEDRPSVPDVDAVMRGRRAPTTVVLAGLLGLFGVGVAAAAIWLAMPHPKKSVPPLVFSAADATAVPRASIAPLEPPSEAPDATTLVPPPPLPSLVPSPVVRPSQGRGKPGLGPEVFP